MKLSTPSKRMQTDPDMESGGASITPPRRPTPPDEVSPTGTFDTALTSPTRTFDSTDSPPPTKITIDHVTRSKGGARSAGLLLGMTKPVMGIVMLLVLGAGGAAAFGWFKIPGLTSQIEKLEAQVGALNAEIGRLSGEVDRLESENDRYEDLNDYLNQTVADFEILTDDLNATVIELDGVAGRLNLTNLELAERINDLATENENYVKLNRELNATSAQLAKDVDFFADALARMVLENGVLSNLTNVLQDMTSQLGNLTLEQNETLIQLQETLADFVSENDRLEELNLDLFTIVTFLNETAVGLDDSLQQITKFLAEQIVANQVLVLGSLENTYRQRISSWDCDYRDIFREEAFGTDFSAPITDIDSVIVYVEERVLSELCLDASDFELYLTSTYAEDLNSFRLVRGVLEYTTEALDFYFPETDEEGLTAADWADASFTCDNLPQQYLWSALNRA